MHRSLVVVVALVASACGSSAPPPEQPIEHETAEDSILRVGQKWRSITEEKGLRSKPSKISVFETRTTSTLELVAGKRTAAETLVVEERFELRDGAQFQCVSRGKLRDPLRYGRFHGEAAVQISRTPQSLPRHCQPAGFGDPDLDLDGISARFALRGDQLVAFDPPLDKRVYLPSD